VAKIEQQYRLRSHPGVQKRPIRSLNDVDPLPADGRHPRLRPQEQRYDTTPLLRDHSHNYSTILGRLVAQWLNTISMIRQEVQDNEHQTSAQVPSIALEALRFLIYSASYQTLSTVRVQAQTNTSKRLHSQLLQDMSTSEMWKMVKRRLNQSKAENAR